VTTYCHIGMGRLGIAVANAMMLLQKGNTHAFFEPVAALRRKACDGEYSEMRMVAQATGNQVVWYGRLPQDCEVYVITAGVPRKSPKQDKSLLISKNYAIVSRLVGRIPPGNQVFIATNPPNEIVPRLAKYKKRVAFPLRSCTDNLRKAVWGDGWMEANNAMLAAKGYTSYGPAVAIAREVLGQ
jgi:malate/lactate dehydrogenase